MSRGSACRRGSALSRGPGEFVVTSGQHSTGEVQVIDVDGASITLMVGDLDQAQAFYTDRLGFSILYRAGSHFAMLDRGGFQVGLHPWGPSGPKERGPGMSIGLAVADIRAAVEELEAGGVAFPGGIVDDDGAILRADFQDPDGTPLYLVERIS